MATVTAQRVLKALDSLDYPASKEAIVEHAERYSVEPDILSALRALPLGDYESREELVRSLDTMETTAQPAAKKGEQARNRGKRGVAEHMRTTEG